MSDKLRKDQYVDSEGNVKRYKVNNVKYREKLKKQKKQLGKDGYMCGAKDELVSASLVEMAGDVLEEDALSLDEIAKYPSLVHETPRTQAIMCALVAGYSKNFIGKMFGISRARVFDIAKRVDPEGAFKASREAKKAFVTRLVETRGLEALSSITPEDLMNATVIEKTRIADTMFKISQNMNQSKHGEKRASRLNSILDMIENESSEDAEFTEAKVDDC